MRPLEPCEYWDEDGCYCVCGAMCSCHPRVGAYAADYSPITPEELAQPTGAEDLLARSHEK